MRVPLQWLQEYVPVEADAREIAARLTMGGFEVEGIEESAVGPVLDVNVTPNRGDCQSIAGIAREVAALCNLPLRLPSLTASLPGGTAAQETSVTLEAPDLCPRYVARLVRGVRVEPSPDWMQARLEAAGQRPINSVVDVTNYVLLEFGQPLHAFDLRRLAGERIVVRRARPGETLRTLDGEDRILRPDMLVIADAVRPVAIAGIMGGAETEVSAQTVDLLLESAHFDPLSVRSTSRMLGLRTEASYRFERYVDPEGARAAVDRACDLLQRMGQPAPVAGAVDVYPSPKPARLVTVRPGRAAELLGMEITREIAVDCLQRLHFEVNSEMSAEASALRVRIPSFRHDCVLEEDLVEEVGRVYGYENVPETLPVGMTTSGKDSAQGSFIARARRALVACGLQEVVTHSLRAPGPLDPSSEAAERVEIRNALSVEVSTLRTSLAPMLLEAARHNAAHGARALAIFEIGPVFRNEPVERAGRTHREPVERSAVAGLLAGPPTASGWSPEMRPAPADFYQAGGILSRVFRMLGISNFRLEAPENALEQMPRFHPGRVAWISIGTEVRAGVIGEVHPRILEALDLRERALLFEIPLDVLQRAAAAGPRFQQISPYPAVVRDLAPRVPAALPYRQIEEAIESAGAPYLEEYRLTDLFRGAPVPADQKSLTLSFTFRSSERTLTDADVNVALERLRAGLERQCNAVFSGG